MRLDRYGWGRGLYSLKCFIGAMLALYVALSIGLPRPYWAMITAYIVSQPQAGAVRSKALYRVIGTTVGGAVTVAMVPALVDAPELLSLALALWVGSCLYFSLLDRTPRAYAMLLAGYTAAIIGFPSVGAPGAIFDTASLRVQEITIGILSGTLVHGLILPQSVTGALLARVDRFLLDAERWSADALTSTRSETLDRERRRIASDITELHIMSTHLPFDTARLLPRTQAVRALQERLSILLPVVSAVDDRLTLVAELGLSPEEQALLADTEAWLRGGADPEAGPLLEARSAALEPVPAPDWPTIVRLSLIARLGELIRVHRQLRLLREELQAPDLRLTDPEVAALLEGASARVLHRDRGFALRSAIAAVIGILMCCAVWIGTAWPEGGVAAMMTAVFCSLFAALDDPVPAIRGFFVYTLLSMPLSALYLFLVLPQVDGYPMLVAVMAPVLLVLGALLANPATSLAGLATVLGLFGSIGFGERFSASFPSFVNGTLAQLGGTAIAFLNTRLFGSLGAEWHARRLIRLGWRDVAALAAGVPRDIGVWTGRMLDRVGLLTPRLGALQNLQRHDMVDMLADVRVGLSTAALAEVARNADTGARERLQRVVDGVRAHYAALVAEERGDDGSLLADIDASLTNCGAVRSIDARASTLALLGIRRNLFPAELPPLVREQAA
ncbi:MAG: FUSC family protein [Sphingomonas sp.]